MRNKIIILVCFIFLYSVQSFAQERFNREVIIKIDTTYERNNKRFESAVVESYVQDGIKLYVVDNPFRVSLISEKKDNYNNGIFLLFYDNTGMPKEKGMFVNGDEDGEWFYWNEKGKLTMKKIWKKGKVLKTIKYK